MKNLKSENPCPMGILLRGGGQASAGARGVDLRAAGQAGEHYDAAVVSENDSEANAQISQKHYMLLGKFDRRRNQRRPAFTMAEILLSLTIIGVVAAITLPSLTGNINERTWNTQRKALYARMSQAIPLMGAINGYTNAETFVTSGLSKVLKINNICDDEHLQDCGLTNKFTTLNANIYTYSLPWKLSDYNPLMTSVSDSTYSLSYSAADNNAVGFETANGESIALFYQPSCQPNMGELESPSLPNGSYLIQPKICINMIYDLNGQKGPNTVGKDVGVMSVLYSTDSVIAAPFPYLRSTPNADFNTALRTCKNIDDNLRLPNLDELAAMFVNSKLIDVMSTSSGGDTWGMWSSKPSTFINNYAWDQSFVSGNRRQMPKTESKKVRCVYR